MNYFDKESVDRGRRNIMGIIILFGMLYGWVLIDEVFFFEESISLLNIARTFLALFVLYSVHRGSERAYFYVQIQIFALIVFPIIVILWVIYDLNSWLHKINYLILLLPAILLSIGIPAIFMIKSKFIKDIEMYLDYKKNVQRKRKSNKGYKLL